MDTTVLETTAFRLLAQMDHSGKKKSLELASHFILLDYNLCIYRTTLVLSLPTLITIKLVPSTKQ